MEYFKMSREAVGLKGADKPLVWWQLPPEVMLRHNPGLCHDIAAKLPGVLMFVVRVTLSGLTKIPELQNVQ